MNLPSKYDAACQAIAEARTVDDVKDIIDKSQALKEYYRRAQNKDLEINAAEIRMRAERRFGEMMKHQKETVGLAKGGTPYKSTGSKEEPVEKTPTLAELGIDKKLSSRAQKMAAVPEDEFEGMLHNWKERVSKDNERVTVNLLREGEQAKRDSDFESKKIVWPEGTYPIIYADPPWRYENPPMGGTNRSIENHYPTMTLEEICALPVDKIAAPDCVLFLWATAPKLSECMEVIKAWGFEYRTGMVWVKDKIGMGYYCRSKHEHLLIARKGTPGTPEVGDRPASVFEYPRNKHSAKPPEFYDLIDQMYPALDKIELFSRSPQQGWNVWGYEADA